MLMSQTDALALMTRNTRGPMNLAYHDPLYDAAGGQGDAVPYDPIAELQAAQAAQQNPGLLMIIIAVLAVIYLLGEE